MVSWLRKDEQDFGDFSVLGKSLVVISMISVISVIWVIFVIWVIWAISVISVRAVHSSATAFDPWSNYRILRNMLKIQKMH